MKFKISEVTMFLLTLLNLVILLKAEFLLSSEE